MRIRQIAMIVSILLLIIAAGLFLARDVINPPIPISPTPQGIMKSPSGSFYFFQDGMPCLGLIFESKTSNDIDVSTTCDWSKWNFNVENIPEEPLEP